MKDYNISASLVCADQGRLIDEVKILEKAKVSMLHVDAMDGVFVPRLGMYPEQVSAIRPYFSGEINIHMITSNPEPFLEWFNDSGADIITVHPEPNQQIARTIQKIKNLGIKAGVCLNIGTPVETLRYILNDVDLVMLMAIHPGILGQNVWPGIYDKLVDVKNLAKELNKENLYIEVDGGVKPETAPLMVKNGANVLTCGTGTIFRPNEDTLENMIEKFRIHMNQYNLKD